MICAIFTDRIFQRPCIGDIVNATPTLTLVSSAPVGASRLSRSWQEGCFVVFWRAIDAALMLGLADVHQLVCVSRVAYDQIQL